MNQTDQNGGNGGNGQNGPAGYAGEPAREILYEVSHIENAQGRVVFVREPVIFDHEGDKPPTEFVGEGMLQMPAPNGTVRQMTVRFPIPAENIVEAYDNFDQCIRLVAEGAAEEARRQQKAGKILAADGKPVIQRGPRR